MKFHKNIYDEGNYFKKVANLLYLKVYLKTIVTQVFRRNCSKFVRTRKNSFLLLCKLILLRGWNGTWTQNNLQPLISLKITYSFGQTGEDISFGDDDDDDDDDDDEK